MAAQPRRSRLSAEARREQILQAALKAFSRRGYHATHVSDIVAEADVARGTFYLHFDSKHAVFDALVTRTLEVFLDVRPAGEEPPIRTRRDAEAILRESYRVVLETFRQHRALLKLLFEEAVGLEKGFRDRLERHFTAWHGRLVYTIRAFQEAGVAREELDPGLTADMVLGMVERITRRHLFARKAPDIERLVEALVAFEMRGLAGR